MSGILVVGTAWTCYYLCPSPAVWGHKSWPGTSQAEPLFSLHTPTLAQGFPNPKGRVVPQ